MSNSNKPHLLLLGATGRVGGLVLGFALDRGYSVTALVRKTDALEASHSSAITTKSLTLIQGNATETEAITAAIRSAFGTSHASNIVIISTLGQTRTSGNPWSAPTSPRLFMSVSAEAVIASIKSFPSAEQGRISKYIVLSAFGTTTSFSNLNFLMRLVMKHSHMDQTVEDHDAVDAVLRGQSSVSWVEVRSAMLKGEGTKQVKTFGEHGEHTDWMPSISCESVAKFLLELTTSSSWDGSAVVISN